MTRLRLRRPLAALALTASAVALAATPASAAGSHSLIQGSGSSWSANAVNQWIADVQSDGLQVVYTPSGSAQGRKDFAYDTTDFAVSEIGYQGVDPVSGADDSSQGRKFAYLPIVAGGTSFPYQIKVGGTMVRNLRLSGETLAKIFTLQIKNWNDPQVTRDNNGHALPSLPIIPVVHSEGSGSTAQFTRYLDKTYPTIWRAYNGAAGLTEYYTRRGAMIAQNGSDGVMNFVSSAAANGSIGYDEYSYALAKNYPVVKLENAAGYFALPTQYNVAVALTQALINQDKSSPNYLLQNLDQVYRYGDKRTYPLSSYSYMIVPIAPDDQKMTTAKRQTISDFLYYSICEGQKEMGPIGYSPLPVNLVQAGFDQIGKLKVADPGVDLTKRSVSTCNNPTFIAGQPTRNHLAEIAPLPPLCDKVGQGPCDANGGSVAPAAGGTKSGGTTTKGGQTATPSAGASGPSAGVQPSAAPSVDPVTGQVVAAGSAGSGDAVAQPLELAASRDSGANGVLGVLSALMLVLALVTPPVIGLALGRRRSGR